MYIVTHDSLSQFGLYGKYNIITWIAVVARQVLLSALSVAG